MLVQPRFIVLGAERRRCRCLTPKALHPSAQGCEAQRSYPGKRIAQISISGTPKGFDSDRGRRGGTGATPSGLWGFG